MHFTARNRRKGFLRVTAREGMDRKIAVLADEWGMGEDTLRFVLDISPSIEDRVAALPDDSVDLNDLHIDCKAVAMGEPLRRS